MSTWVVKWQDSLSNAWASVPVPPSWLGISPPVPCLACCAQACPNLHAYPVTVSRFPTLPLVIELVTFQSNMLTPKLIVSRPLRAAHLKKISQRGPSWWWWQYSGFSQINIINHDSCASVSPFITLLAEFDRSVSNACCRYVWQMWCGARSGMSVIDVRARNTARLTFKFSISRSNATCIITHFVFSLPRSMLRARLSKLSKCQNSNFRMPVINRHVLKEVSNNSIC